MEGLAAFKARWQAADLFYGREIRLIMGILCGWDLSRTVDEQCIAFETADGAISIFIGGELA